MYVTRSGYIFKLMILYPLGTLTSTIINYFSITASDQYMPIVALQLCTSTLGIVWYTQQIVHIVHSSLLGPASSQYRANVFDLLQVPQLDRIGTHGTYRFLRALQKTAEKKLIHFCSQSIIPIQVTATIDV